MSVKSTRHTFDQSWGEGGADGNEANTIVGASSDRYDSEAGSPTSRKPGGQRQKY